MIRREAYIICVALLVAMGVGSGLIMLVGKSPLQVYGLLFARTWGDWGGLGQVVAKATPLIFTGLAVAVAFRCGLFNIGGEGQMIVGAFAMALVGAWLPAATPTVVALVVALCAGAACGAVLGAIPGALRAYTGGHEVINTIMLNSIAAAVVLWAGNAGLFVDQTHTPTIIAQAQLPKLGFAGSAANVSFLLALVCAGSVWYFLARTRRGYEWRAVGLNAKAAQTAGVRLKATIIGAMAVSGALAGLAGSHYVLGYKHYFENGVGRGVGFMGIAVALLGRNHPVGIVLAALLLATMAHGGLEISGHVPKEIVDVLQAVIILAVAAASADVRRVARTAVARVVKRDARAKQQAEVKS